MNDLTLDEKLRLIKALASREVADVLRDPKLLSPDLFYNIKPFLSTCSKHLRHDVETGNL